MQTPIKHDESNHQFYIEIEGKRSYLDYEKVDNNTLEYQHTFVPIEFRDQGLAGKIVDFALSYAQEKGLSVIPSCPFVQNYLANHPQYNKIIK